MRSLPQTGQCGRVDVMAGGSEKARNRPVAPATVAASKDQDVGRHMTPRNQMRMAFSTCIMPLSMGVRESGVVTLTDSEIYYDPYDTTIDADPYPVWKRLRDERPLYYNEKHDFYALSRFADVENGLSDWKTYISGKGTLLEIIKSGMEMPPGSIIFEDPPDHDLHRALLSRVFRPRAIADLEPKIREFCARSLDPLVGSAGFDFIADLGAQMPMRTIGLLLGIPEADQEALREQIDESLRLADGAMPDISDQYAAAASGSSFEEYIDWRADN